MPGDTQDCECNPRKCRIPDFSCILPLALAADLWLCVHYLRWEATVAGDAEPLGLESGLSFWGLSGFAADAVTGVERGSVYLPAMTVPRNGLPVSLLTPNAL